MKVLVAEDDPTSALLMKSILRKSGYEHTITTNGVEALAAAKGESFDVLLTDWMMPDMDGIELVRNIRAEVDPPPLIAMVTTINSPGARKYALEAGADDYLSKPVTPKTLLACIEGLMARGGQGAPAVEEQVEEAPVEAPSEDELPPFVVVCIGASTGGPSAIRRIVAQLPEMPNAAFCIVQQGPEWLLGELLNSIKGEGKMPAFMAETGEIIKPSRVYLAPADRHLYVKKDPVSLLVDVGQPVNFVRPSADCLFKSAGKVFGKRCLVVVLTGIGRDGAAGAATVQSVGGTVLVQNPKGAFARQMPQSAVDLDFPSTVVSLRELPLSIANHIDCLMKMS
ncbi:MAG: chemotaxis protein CheB [Pseudomonadota bacterium]